MDYDNKFHFGGDISTVDFSRPVGCIIRCFSFERNRDVSPKSFHRDRFPRPRAGTHICLYASANTLVLTQHGVYISSAFPRAHGALYVPVQIRPRLGRIKIEAPEETSVIRRD